MLKDHTTINYMIKILEQLKDGIPTTSQELSQRLSVNGQAPPQAYFRKVLTRMVKAKLLISCGMEGYNQFKPFQHTTLSDVLQASEPMLLEVSPASRGEDRLHELATKIKIEELI